MALLHGGAGVSPGYAHGKCLFRIVTPELTHQRCKESIYCRFELSLTEEKVIKNRTEPSEFIVFCWKLTF